MGLAGSRAAAPGGRPPAACCSRGAAHARRVPQGGSEAHRKSPGSLSFLQECCDVHFLTVPSLWAVLERYTQAKEIYQEALKQAELKKDEVSIQHIREELAGLARKSSPLA